MKTLIKRIQTALQTDATISQYVASNSIQVVSPDLLPDISQTALPYIGIAPISTSEAWFSTGIQNVTHIVNIYVCQILEIVETAILGDTVKPGLLELLTYVENATRAKQFASAGVNYLSKPSQIAGVRYSTSPYGDNVFVFVGTITLQCVRQIVVVPA